MVWPSGMGRARPSAVLLEATGWTSAIETASRRLSEIPVPSKRRTTLAARAPASSQLVGYRSMRAGPIGLLSVCPMTMIWWGDFLS